MVGSRSRGRRRSVCISVSVVGRVGLGLLLRRRVSLVEVLRIRLGGVISSSAPARLVVPSSLVQLLLLLLRLLSFGFGIRLDSWNELGSDEDESSADDGREGDRRELIESGERSFDLLEGKERKGIREKRGV